MTFVRDAEPFPGTLVAWVNAGGSTPTGGTSSVWNWSASYDPLSLIYDSNKLRVPATGVYHLCGIMAAQPNTTGTRRTVVSKNGTDSVLVTVMAGQPSYGHATRTAAVVELDAGDYLQAGGLSSTDSWYQNSGGSLPLTLYLTVWRLA